ncbi:endo-1,4-beta-xylanase [Cellvibrio japonicus]|nr:endo-1,4-beta-xylanase [Cellvibrio japonicus]
MAKSLGAAAFLGAALFAHTLAAQTATCSYNITNEWNTGYTGDITITNRGSSAINGWSVNWQYATNRLSSSWNANVSGSNPYSASNLSWNGNIQPGQSVSFGFQVNKNGGSAERPSVGGSICSGSVASSSAPASSVPSSIASSSPSSVASSVISSMASSSPVSSSSVASSTPGSSSGNQQCNWYGTLYPLCVTTTNGWGWEDQRSCIARSTCAAQPAPFGIVGSGSSTPVSSSSSSLSSSSVVSSIRSSSSSSSSSVATGNGLASLADFPIGVAVAASGGNADIFTSSARQNIVRAEFNQITAENIMKMSYMYSGSNFSFTNSDRLVSWAAQNGQTVHGHALVWHPSYQLPNWASDSNANFRQDFARHIDTVAAHFAGQVKSWDVVNEALFDSADDPDGRGSANGYRQSVFYRQFGGPEYIDEAFRRARAADPTAELYYNDFNTEENGAKTTALVNLVQRLLNNGVPIDGVGFQMHVMNDYPSIANIRQAMQKIVALSPTLKIKITELDVRLNNPYDGNSSNDYTNRNDCAVSCAGLDRQKARYKEIVQAYLEVVPPGRRGGITVWGIADPDSWLYTHQNLPDWPLLFNDNLQPKPAYQGVVEALSGR